MKKLALGLALMGVVGSGVGDPVIFNLCNAMTNSRTLQFDDFNISVLPGTCYSMTGDKYNNICRGGCNLFASKSEWDKPDNIGEIDYSQDDKKFEIYRVDYNYDIKSNIKSVPPTITIISKPGY